MIEPQYNALHSYPRAQLGLMVNQCWYDDPKMVGIHMARYKFVAKMLAGKQMIAEIGSADGMYTSIVHKHCAPSILHAYDFDPEWKNECPATLTHDICTGPLPLGPYDGIYSLDVMEHIADEDAYLKHVKDSLKNNGVFIVGMPSLESQAYASPLSKEGHINCKSGEELRRLLLGHFPNVFIFGMNDEVVHTGFLPMCHYLLAVCVC